MLEINSRKRSEYNTNNDVSVQVASTKIAREAAADANLEVFRRVSWKDKDKDKLVSQSCFVLQPCNRAGKAILRKLNSSTS